MRRTLRTAKIYMCAVVASTAFSFPAAAQQGCQISKNTAKCSLGTAVFDGSPGNCLMTATVQSKDLWTVESNQFPTMKGGGDGTYKLMPNGVQVLRGAASWDFTVTTTATNWRMRADAASTDASGSNSASIYKTWVGFRSDDDPNFDKLVLSLSCNPMR